MKNTALVFLASCFLLSACAIVRHVVLARGISDEFASFGLRWPGKAA